MRVDDPLERFPETVPQSSEPDAPAYRRIVGRFAVLGPLPDELRDRLVHSLSGETHLLRGRPEPGLARAPAPAYRLGGQGPEAVPTGRLFVRFAEAIEAASRAADLARLGLAIDEVPEYARHAAWVRYQRGDRAGALRAAAAVARLAGVERVEPEMLRERALRERA